MMYFLQRGTEKYHHESDSEKNKKWGVAWYKDDYNGRDDIVIIGLIYYISPKKVLNFW